MLTTTITCDACKNTIEADDEGRWKYAEVRVDLKRYPYGNFSKWRGGHWCVKCAAKNGVDMAGCDLPKPEAQPTLEDLIREIARDEATDVVAEEL